MTKFGFGLCAAVCLLGQGSPYTATYSSIISDNSSKFFARDTNATIYALQSAASSMPVLTSLLRSLTSVQINICNGQLSNEAQLYVDVTTFMDYYQDLLFNFGFNYIGTKYHTSGALIYNLHNAIEECVESVDVMQLAAVRNELDDSLATVRRSKSYADIDFTRYCTAQETYSSMPLLPFSAAQRRNFETGYQLDLFNRVYRDTWTSKRQVVAASNTAEATKLAQIQAVLSSAGINQNFTTFIEYETYYQEQARKWFISKSGGINFSNDFDTLFSVRQQLIGAEGYSGFPYNDLVGAAEEFKRNSNHVSSAWRLMNNLFLMSLALALRYFAW